MASLQRRAADPWTDMGLPLIAGRMRQFAACLHRRAADELETFALRNLGMMSECPGWVAAPFVERRFADPTDHVLFKGVSWNSGRNRRWRRSTKCSTRAPLR